MEPSDSPKIHSLWKEYTATHSLETRNKLVENYLPLVRYAAGLVASRLPPHLRLDDLASSGKFGLISAVERFNSHLGVEFGAYARPRILGAIFDELRRVDFVPRRVRRKMRDFERTTGRLTSILGREPTPEELADELGLEAEELIAFREEMDKVPDFVSLDGFFEDREDFPSVRSVRDVRDVNVVGQLDRILQKETSKRVQAALARLTRTERIVLKLIYFEDETMQDAGSLIGVTESRISQLHSQAIRRFKKYYISEVAKE